MIASCGSSERSVSNFTRMSPLFEMEYLLDKSRVSWLGAQLISTCSVTGVAAGAGGSGAKSR